VEPPLASRHAEKPLLLKGCFDRSQSFVRLGRERPVTMRYKVWRSRLHLLCADGDAAFDTHALGVGGPPASSMGFTPCGVAWLAALLARLQKLYLFTSWGPGP